MYYCGKFPKTVILKDKLQIHLKIHLQYVYVHTYIIYIHAYLHTYCCTGRTLLKGFHEQL